MRDPEAMQVEQLEILKQQIDSPAGHFDFSKAHIRYLKCCECLNRFYDDIRKMRRQALLNKVKATGSALRIAELSALKMDRISGLPDLKIGDESWIQGVPKGYLQREVAKAVLARRMLDDERDRLLPMKEEAAAAEQASR
ncbi:hypothetical protein LTR33_013549 [Friedmanniomyces endolithicus]|nr:hypothetical protein LTR33_013549 [Friedmanniomyces endolithicus]